MRQVEGERKSEVGPAQPDQRPGTPATSRCGSSNNATTGGTFFGYSYYANADAASGFVLPPIQVRGIAPDATIIPVKVLADYQIPAFPQCADATASQNVVFGTSEMVAAGIDYVTSLKQGVLSGHPVVINMSLGGDPDVPVSDVEKAAIDRAIAAGVIVVAAASNDGELGMSAPGSYGPVISAGAVGWTGEWLDDGASGNAPANGVRYRMWWLQNVSGPGEGTPGTLAALNAGSGDVVEGAAVAADTYVTDFSSRALAPTQLGALDVLAPGSWVRGPFAGDPGYNHLPWYSHGIADLIGHIHRRTSTTSAGPRWRRRTWPASPPSCSRRARPSPRRRSSRSFAGARSRCPPRAPGRSGTPSTGAGRLLPLPRDTDCGGVVCDAVGAGLLQADAAIAATP